MKNEANIRLEGSLAVRQEANTEVKRERGIRWEGRGEEFYLGRRR